MGENKETKEKIEINIDNTDSALNWVEKFLGLLSKYGFWKILWATIGVAIVSILLYFAFNWEEAFKLYDAWKSRMHDDNMELRVENGPKVQSLIDKLTYKVNASRVLVLELHNGVTSGGGLPFTKCSATYESLNIAVSPVAEQYQEVNMSLMPFTNFLFEHGYWCGDTEELLDIDKALYHKMKSNKTDHFAACMIEGVNDKAIAFLIVSFDEPLEELQQHECENIREYIRHIAMEVAIYLEVNRLTKS